MTRPSRWEALPVGTGGTCAGRALLAVTLLAPALVVVLAVGSARAEELTTESGDARWLPSVAAFGGLLFQDAMATIDSTQRGFHESDALAVFAHVGISVELMTPVMLPRLGSPRLFVHGDFAGSFDAEESIVSENDPGKIRIPVIDNDSDGTPDGEPPVEGIQGRGSATKAQTERFVYSAGAGVVFQFEALGRPLRVKPSVEWLYLETQITGSVGDAEALDGGDQCPCRTLLVETSRTRGFHHLGAGLELELDAARAGPFMLSVFGSAQGYHVIGNRRVELTASGDFVEPSGPPTESLSLRSTYEIEPWHYRIAFGLRFRWQPE